MNTEQVFTLTQLEEHPELVAEVLSEQHASWKRTEDLGLRPLGLGLHSLIWFLRLYVVFMVAVVGLNVFQTLNP